MIHLDPVEAYDHIALEFARLSNERRAYIDAIDRLVISEIPREARSLLDIGAADGSRARRIAAARALSEVTLLEPSAAMRALWPPETRGWPIRAEDLGGQSGRFDVITCLWNVLGHVFPSERRMEVLKHCGRLLSERGLIFIDVSHRYNARHYGLAPTFLRMLRDRVFPNDNNGDVTAHWSLNGTSVDARGHVFTDFEFRGMASAAGLAIRKVVAVDYGTGEIRRSNFSGHLLYVLAKTPGPVTAPA